MRNVAYRTRGATSSRNSSAANSPYAKSALACVRDGISPIPVKGKVPLVSGHHGRAGAWVTPSLADEWAQLYHSDIAARLPRDMVGLDVDDYDGKAGGRTLAELESELGDLPLTIRSTARWGQGESGIKWFRVPDSYLNAEWAGIAGPGIEIVSWSNRYAIIPPSFHAGVEREYGWYDESTGIELIWPEFSEMPELPKAWCQHLSNGSYSAGPRVAVADADKWLDERMTTGDPCGQMAETRDKRVRLVREARDAGGIHNAAISGIKAVIGDSIAGHPGGWSALGDLEDAFLAARYGRTGDRKRKTDARHEWFSMVHTAAGEPDLARRKIGDTDPCAELEDMADIRPIRNGKNGRNLPDEFWEYMPELERIRQAAYSRGRSADAALGVVFARMSAFAPVDLALDAGLGLTPITLFAALCGPPESGKSVSIRVGMDLLPESQFGLDGVFAGDLPLGSGEGIAEAYYTTVTERDSNGKTKSVRRKLYDQAFFSEDEGQKLVKTMSKGGNIIAETIRSAWSGNQIGQSNARAESTRKVNPGDYSIGIVVGFQPETIQSLLSDEEAASGTPQRFLYLSATDPNVP